MNLSDRCNLRCAWCYARGEDAQPYRADRVRKQIQWFMGQYPQGENTPSISFFGGEPLVEWDGLLETVVWARETFRKSIKFGIVTNGVLLTPLRLATLMDLGVNVSFSIDGCAEAIDACRKTPGGDAVSEVIIANAIHFCTQMKMARARMTVSPETVQYLFESVRFLYEDVGFGQINPVMAGGVTWDAAHLATLKREIRKVTDWWIEKVRQGVVPDIYHLRNALSAYHRGSRDPQPCKAWWWPAP